jgi:hypothetical protein
MATTPAKANGAAAAALAEAQEVIAQQIDTAKPTGPAAAALISAGIGSTVLGLLTTLAEASPAVKTFLNFYNPVGPLAGKTTWAVVAYLVSWAILALVLRGKNPPFGRVVRWTYALVGLGLIGTFPIFFEAFTVK